MSLLDVFVIFAYYEKAEINPKFANKITNQQFDNKYVIYKIKEIEQYYSSALHWNLNELKNNLHEIIDKAKKYYKKIANQTNVNLHNFNGIDNFKSKIGKDVEAFMRFSREKAEKAQSREIVTTQPKETLSTLTKAKITITNYLGGEYFFTVDEVWYYKGFLFLTECKHAKNSLLPSISDIKDGLLKMILYSNLCEVRIKQKISIKVKCKAELKLTSPLINGKFSTEYNLGNEKAEFFEQNKFSKSQIEFLEKLFEEARENNFIVIISKSK
ncbi:MAG: hypothetical protein LBK94_03565 [Prevotellaceae bacterium]|jgi:hypothetical protein|nr:hypothetical protein [Prevotellaceae bacterium]